MEGEYQSMETYPLLYADKGKPDHISLMCYGFEGVGIGWKKILEDLSYVLEHKIEEWISRNPEKKDGHPRAFQVKEKFGGLRFYMTSELDDEAASCIDRAEQISLKTCLECGKAVTTQKVNERGWVTTICSDCDNVNGN